MRFLKKGDTMKHTLKILIGAVIVGLIVPLQLYVMSLGMHRFSMSLSAVSPTIQWTVIIIVAILLAAAGLKLIYDGIRE
jgi:hypothetical protein